MRYLDALSSVPSTLAYGLRAKLKEGYHAADLRADLMAGLVVGIVALPLSMALAIASGVAPQHGLYTAIIAGIVSALLGGTRCQVTGPTAAFVVILVPIVAKFGLGGLLVAGLLAGVMLVGMGAAGLGRLIQYIPHPVTTGFTAGIAIVIGTTQLKDFVGLHLDHTPETYVERWHLMAQALPTFSPWELALGALTLALLVYIPRVQQKIPAPLIALGAAALLAAALSHFAASAQAVPAGARSWLEQLMSSFHVETIGSRFSSIVDGRTVRGIPPLPPMPHNPFTLPGPGGQPFVLSFHTIQQLAGPAFAIAMLGAIESLLSAVVSDGMSGTRHDPNAELIGLGIANILCPIFGGIAATGAIARTATNIRAGARSPFASVFHSLFILLCTIVLAPLVSYLPMTSLAALLLLVAKNMAEARHFAHIVRVAPRSDVMVLLVCFGLTVFFDMVIAVSVGVVLAALLFMRRMAEITDVKLDTGTMAKLDLPEGVLLYEIAGPLFFGAAQKAMSVLDTVDGKRVAVILYLGQVPAIDGSGLVALETIIEKLTRGGHKVILAGLQKQPSEVIAHAGIVRRPGQLAIAPDLDSALSLAILHTARIDHLTPTTPATV